MGVYISKKSSKYIALKVSKRVVFLKKRLRNKEAL